MNELPIDMESLDYEGGKMTAEEWTVIAEKQYEQYLKKGE